MERLIIGDEVFTLKDCSINVLKDLNKMEAIAEKKYLGKAKDFDDLRDYYRELFPYMSEGNHDKIDWDAVNLREVEQFCLSFWPRSVQYAAKLTGF